MTETEAKITAILDNLSVPAERQPPDDPETGPQPPVALEPHERLQLLITRYGENLQQYDAGLRHAHASNLELAVAIKKAYRYLERGHVLNAKARLGTYVRRIRQQEEVRKADRQPKTG